MAKDTRQDSLFMGFHFGMERKAFFAQCWELNKQGLMRQGTENTTVMHEIKTFKNKARMNFYPDYFEDKIYKIPVTFAYDGWAPWNKDLSSDKLIIEVLDLMKEWYGDDFLEVEHKKLGKLYIRQDSNRRITVFIRDDRYVNVMFIDASVESKVPKTPEGPKPIITPKSSK